MADTIEWVLITNENGTAEVSLSFLDNRKRRRFLLEENRSNRIMSDFSDTTERKA